ncbi:hypothetical protein MJO29_014595 [Puccinia striiformis f. sp. tritici]|nr:hypothetical protein MJO29_014595 [Puccinia striiformis f. sp. tritici]
MDPPSNINSSTYNGPSPARDPATDHPAAEKINDQKTIQKALAIEVEEGKEGEELSKTFEELGLISELCKACRTLDYKTPTPIQAESIPYALEDRDIIGLAQTGSGKTAAFALPVLQSLWNDPKPFFCCVLAPTRELAYQISQQFDALGSTIGVKTAVIVGGIDMMSQAIALSKRVTSHHRGYPWAVRASALVGVKAGISGLNPTPQPHRLGLARTKLVPGLDFGLAGAKSSTC